MLKNIQILLYLLGCISIDLKAQNINFPQAINNSKGYYQTIDIDSDTPCNCNDKTQRTHDLARGLFPSDVSNYELHAYQFSFGTSTTGASKLFKSLENDMSVYKVSMKEWNSFMLLTTKDFDALSFEIAASKVFDSFSIMQPDVFLKEKNLESYNEFQKNLEHEKSIKANNTKPQ